MERLTEFYRQMWEAVNQKGRWQGETVNRRRDDSEVPVLLSITPIYQGGFGRAADFGGG